MGYANKEEQFIAQIEHFVNNEKVLLRDALSHIGDTEIAHEKEVRRIATDALAKIDLNKRTYDFTKRQIQILAEYEKELKELDRFINSAYDQYWHRDSVRWSNDQYNDITRDLFVSSSNLLNKNYVAFSSLYNELVTFINKINDFQHSKSWQYLDAEKQQYLQNIYDKMQNKKTDVEQKSTNVFYGNNRPLFAIIIFGLAILASIQGAEWLCVTIPLAYFYITNMVLFRMSMKSVEITLFATYIAIILSIIIPVKGSSIAIFPLALFGLIYIACNKNLISEKFTPSKK